MRGILFSVCEAGLVDANTNALRLINLIVDINAASFPVAVPKLAAVGIFEREEGDGELLPMNLLVSLNGETLSEVPWQIDFQGKRRVQTIAMLQGLPITQPGKLRFALSDSHQLLYWDINIQSIGPQVDLFSQTAQAAVPQP
jgi:hypothetical protein